LREKNLDDSFCFPADLRRKVRGKGADLIRSANISAFFSAEHQRENSTIFLPRKIPLPFFLFPRMLTERDTEKAQI